MTPTPVTLHLYDLSNGMARSMSMAIIGKQLDGIWHSGLVVFGVEYFFGGGICAAPAGHAIPSLPYQEIRLGTTTKSQIELERFLESINLRYTQATYSLLRHNCNNFADEVAKFLLNGQGIPEHIIRLPQEFLSSPLGATFAPMIEQMEGSMRAQVLGSDGGLNPFAHIRGRSLLFENPPVGAMETMVKVPDDEPLLKSAVNGIPVSVMSAEMKDRLLKFDSTIIPELVAIMKSKFDKTKKPVLMSFGAIARFWVKFPEFLTGVEDVVSDIVMAGLGGDKQDESDVHLISTALALLANWTAFTKEYKETLRSIVEDVFLPFKYPTTSKKNNQLCIIILNNALRHDPPNIPLFSRAVTALVNHAGDTWPSIPQLARTVEYAAKLLLVEYAHVECGTVEEIVSMAETIAEKHNVNMESTLQLMLQ
jgi:hypothetical protein